MHFLCVLTASVHHTRATLQVSGARGYKIIGNQSEEGNKVFQLIFSVIFFHVCFCYLSVENFCYLFVTYGKKRKKNIVAINKKQNRNEIRRKDVAIKSTKICKGFWSLEDNEAASKKVKKNLKCVFCNIKIWILFFIIVFFYWVSI